MFLLRLLFKNAFRHPLRTSLTMVGVVVAIVAYGLMNTVIEAWYAGANAASSTRLITRSAISMAHPLPVSHASQIRAVEGVSGLTWATWFGGVYKDKRDPFAKFAIDADSYFDLFPEYKLSQADIKAFQNDRQGAIIGPRLAQSLGLKVGDVMPIRGDIYPGNWSFTVRGIYATSDNKTDDTLMLVHWKLLSEELRKRFGNDLAEQAGVYVVGIRQAGDAAAVSRRIDALFRDSHAQTRTETEKSYQLAIVAMSNKVLNAIRLVSLVLILIVVAVLANTMMLSSEERRNEYATLKALGFPPSFIAWLLLGESLTISALGGAVGMALTYPASAGFVSSVGSLVNGFAVSMGTVTSQISIIVLIALAATVWPAWKMSRLLIAPSLQKAC